MEAIITPDMLKKHMLIDTDKYDEIIQDSCKDAGNIMLDLLKRDREEIEFRDGKAMKPIEHACLVLAEEIANYRINNKSFVGFRVPRTVASLIEPYAKKGLIRRIFDFENYIENFINKKKGN